jgi:DnaJ like chaperone protein
MAIWGFFDRLMDGVRGGVVALMDRLAGMNDPAQRQVAFTVALVALTAKMARADGIVTADEVAAFRRIVEVPPDETARVQDLFDLAKKDIAGFDVYAGRIRRIAEDDTLYLADILDGLFAIAGADGYVHEAEMAFLNEVATIFGLDDAAFERVAARHVRRRGPDPYAVLGLDRSCEDAEVKRRWRDLVIANHPDKLMARGLPPEALKLAADRVAAFNVAYEAIRAERGLS